MASNYSTNTKRSGTTRKVEKVNKHPFGMSLLQQSPTSSTQKGKKNEKDFLSKDGRILRYQCPSIELIHREERQQLNLTSELSLELDKL